MYKANSTNIIKTRQYKLFILYIWRYSALYIYNSYRLFLRCFGFLRSGFVIPDQNSRIDLGKAGFGVAGFI